MALSRVMGSYYDLLGVPPNATEMEIRSAYGRDVLRLQEAPSDKTAQFRSTLDAALATLTDPEKRAAYDAQLVSVMQDVKEDAADASDEAFKSARNGGIAFALGGLITAGSYFFSDGTYILAWGPLIFGGLALVAGMVKYLMVPSGTRRPSHLLAVAGLVAVGALSAGYVAMSEGIGTPEAAEHAQWNALIEKTNKEVEQADTLVNTVAGRSGWVTQDSVDMQKASTLYADVADVMARATVPARLGWYQTAMSQNFREAAAITHELSLLSGSSPASAFESLERRWNARVDQFNQLADRFDAQEGKTR